MSASQAHERGRTVRRLALAISCGASLADNFLPLFLPPYDGGPYVMTVNNGLWASTPTAALGATGQYGPGPNPSTRRTTQPLPDLPRRGRGRCDDRRRERPPVPARRGARTRCSALRSGGFVTAALDSSNPARVFKSVGTGGAGDQWAKVSVRRWH